MTRDQSLVEHLDIQQILKHLNGKRRILSDLNLKRDKLAVAHFKAASGCGVGARTRTADTGELDDVKRIGIRVLLTRTVIIVFGSYGVVDLRDLCHMVDPPKNTSKNYLCIYCNIFSENNKGDFEKNFRIVPQGAEKTILLYIFGRIILLFSNIPPSNKKFKEPVHINRNARILSAFFAKQGEKSQTYFM